MPTMSATTVPAPRYACSYHHSQKPHHTKTLSFLPVLLPLAMEKLVRSLMRPIIIIPSFVAVSVTLFFVCSSYREETAMGGGGSWRTGMVVDAGAGGGGGDGCDIFQGKWVWDEGYPLYESRECSFLMDEGFQCAENGRPDLFYTKWRWQPNGCDLPRFDAKRMLESLRNKRVVFAGDSIGRNQWESLLCMLSSGVPDKGTIYEVNGYPITKHKGFLVFRFRDYNCTVEYYRAPFLVLHARAPPGVPRNVTSTLKLDAMDWRSTRWREADMLVLNAGHWWNSEKTLRSGIYFQEENKIKMEMSVENAYKRSMKTLLDWIRNEVNTSKTQVLFRTYAPAHFRNNNWKTGDGCRSEKSPELGSLHLPTNTWASFMEPFMNISSDHSTSMPMLELLNITQMTALRKDGHLSLYYRNSTNRSLLKEDCSHWCLPGVPDAWNELLYVLFLRRESALKHHATVSSSEIADMRNRTSQE